MGLHKSYCGDVYLIAEMDPDNRVDETKESNNYHAEMVRVACSGGQCTKAVAFSAIVILFNLD